MCRGCAKPVGWLLAAAMLCALSPALLQARLAPQNASSGDSLPISNWQTAARLHHGLSSEPGTLMLDGNGIEFHPKDRPARRWPYTEVKTFDLRARRLVLTDYENRGHHRSGERGFRFDLTDPVPPAVAAELAQIVAKPARNRDPNPASPSLFTIAARHGTRFGGTNGVLRFREEGIDYVTSDGQDGRSWRWADIQTLACPDPYHLRISAYRETFEFGLKQPMHAEKFDRLWDKLYASDLKGLQIDENARQSSETGAN
jgi:hypothetical protein